MKINPLYENIGHELNLGRFLKSTIIQSLWGGYGEIVRLVFSNKSVIVKHIKLPDTTEHPYGWNSDFSHQRKIYSYEVEVNWYKIFSPNTDKRCLIPKALKCFKTENEWLIVMEDLATLGFKNTVVDANINHLKSSLYWLANFHARYMGVKNDKIWEIGTYWHLDTRPDEFEALEDKNLKKFARQIDLELKNAKYQTIVHGDAKLANFCFNDDGTLASAVDFQYVGHGCGMKDVILFMSSAVKPENCLQMEEWILSTYFTSLKEALKYYQPKLDSNEVEKEWRVLFSVSWADFQRFVKAWRPNHFKINPYTEGLSKYALDYLKYK